MKLCRECGELLPWDRFHRDPKMRDGLKSKCKDCNRKRMERWRSSNREKVEAQRRRYYARVMADPDRRAARAAYREQYDRMCQEYAAARRGRSAGDGDGN